MLEILLSVLAFGVIMTLCGAIGERMMSYGRENGLVKDNYDFCGQPSDKKEKAPDAGTSDAKM